MALHLFMCMCVCDQSILASMDPQYQPSGGSSGSGSSAVRNEVLPNATLAEAAIKPKRRSTRRESIIMAGVHSIDVW